MSVFSEFEVLQKPYSEVIDHFLKKPYIGSAASNVGDLWWRCALATVNFVRPQSSYDANYMMEEIEESLQTMISVIEKFSTTNVFSVTQMFVPIIDNLQKMVKYLEEDKSSFGTSGPQRYILAMTIREDLLNIWNIQFV